jgi:hypothetical protein
MTLDSFGAIQLHVAARSAQDNSLLFVTRFVPPYTGGLWTHTWRRRRVSLDAKSRWMRSPRWARSP